MRFVGAPDRAWALSSFSSTCSSFFSSSSYSGLVSSFLFFHPLQCTTASFLRLPPVAFFLLFICEDFLLLPLLDINSSSFSLSSHLSLPVYFPHRLRLYAYISFPYASISLFFYPIQIILQSFALRFLNQGLLLPLSPLSSLIPSRHPSPPPPPFLLLPCLLPRSSTFHYSFTPFSIMLLLPCNILLPIRSFVLPLRNIYLHLVYTALCNPNLVRSTDDDRTRSRKLDHTREEHAPEAFEKMGERGESREGQRERFTHLAFMYLST